MSIFDLSGLGKTKLPSVIKDPFSKKSCKRIWVSFSENLFDDNWAARGTVEFKNGETKGEQSFEAKGPDAFDQVVLQIREFLKELK